MSTCPLNPATKSLRCTAVPDFAVRTIRKSIPVFGSQGRALQVATEVLIRQKKPIHLKYKIKKAGKEVTVSYKLLPRTIKLIDLLAIHVYGTRGEVIMACSEVIKETKCFHG
jgi:hypothetical protein